MARWRNDVEPLLRRHEAAIRARFPQVRKNSAGYALDHYLEHGDLIDIVIGSEGTLGVITDVTIGSRAGAATPGRAARRRARPRRSGAGTSKRSGSTIQRRSSSSIARSCA